MKLAFRCAWLAVIASVFLLLATPAKAWEKEDHEIFDLVDEVEKVAGDTINFYSFLGIETNADKKEISRGYRKQSLLWHPDKNSDANAPKRQKLIGVVAAILRNEANRKRYDFFMKNGVPRWRGTGYYYRRTRPGIVAVLIGLVLFISALQYLAAWVNCLRRRSMFEELVAREAAEAVRRAPRRSMKKSGSNPSLAASQGEDTTAAQNVPAADETGAANPEASSEFAEPLDPENDPLVQFPSPKPTDVIIFQVPRAIANYFVSLPNKVLSKPSEAEEDSDEYEDSAKSGKKSKAEKKAAQLEAKATGAAKKTSATIRKLAKNRPVNPNYVAPVTGTSKAEWTAEDEKLLSELIVKFPPKTVGRWAFISKALGREEKDVVSKAKELKQ